MAGYADADMSACSAPGRYRDELGTGVGELRAEQCARQFATAIESGDRWDPADDTQRRRTGAAVVPARE